MGLQPGHEGVVLLGFSLKVHRGYKLAVLWADRLRTAGLGSLVKAGLRLRHILHICRLVPALGGGAAGRFTLVRIPAAAAAGSKAE